MSPHLQHESIWVFNLQYCQRGAGRFFFIKSIRGGFVLQLQIFPHLMARLWVSSERKRNSEHEVPACWTSSPALCSLHPALEDTASTHWPSSETASQSKWRAECLTQHAIIHLGCVCCSDLPWCSCPHIPTTTHYSPYRGSALCQPWSGTHYRSCWNEGF